MAMARQSLNSDYTPSVAWNARMKLEINTVIALNCLITLYRNDVFTGARSAKYIKSTIDKNKIYPLLYKGYSEKRLTKNDGLRTVQKHAMLRLPCHRTSQRGAFEIATGDRQSLGTHRVMHALRPAQ